MTMIFMQYGGLLCVRNRRVSILSPNLLWGLRRNLAVPAGMAATAGALIEVANLYGPGIQRVFEPPLLSLLNFGAFRLHLLLEIYG